MRLPSLKHAQNDKGPKPERSVTAYNCFFSMQVGAGHQVIVERKRCDYNTHFRQINGLRGLSRNIV